MDAQACFNDIITALKDKDIEAAQEASCDLQMWLIKDGFMPTITKQDLIELLHAVDLIGD